MKRTLLTLALMTAAGTAAAQDLPPPPGGSGQTALLSVGAAAPPGGAAGLDTSIALYKAKQRRAAAIEAANTETVAALQSDVPVISPRPPAPAPRLTGAAATAGRLIERKGYMVVQGPQRDSDGKWYALALRGTTVATVSVDAAGRVSTH
jgi:hypothetical protein